MYQNEKDRLSDIYKTLKSKNLASFKPVIRMAGLASLCDAAIVVILYSGARLSNEQPGNRLFALFMLTFLLYIISYRSFTRRLTTLVEDHISKIRLKIMDRVRNIDLRSFEKIGAEAVYTALTYDVKSVAEISHLIVSTSKASISMTVCTAYLAFLSGYAFLIAVSVAGLAGGFYVYNQFLIKQVIDQLREREKNLFEAVRHLLLGFKELRINDRKNDDFFYQSLRYHASHLRELNLQTARHFIDNYTLSFGSWKTLILSIVLILPVLGIFTGKILLTFVGLILFMPVSVMIENIPRFILASISIRRLYELEQALEHLDQETSDMICETKSAEFREIRYEGIAFHYEENGNQAFSVGPLDISIQPGEIIFVTGGNGSGKSTLLKLITGLYPIHSGNIYLDNTEIQILRHRSLFSAVFTDFHLFDRLYGADDIDEARVDELIRLMKLEGVVQYTGGRFSTLDLSAGQRKRLAMIGTILEDKPIYIFDEWAADQDPHFRKYFYENLLQTFKDQGKTVIAVTHDDNYFYMADRILKIDYGKFEV